MELERYTKNKAWTCSSISAYGWVARKGELSGDLQDVLVGKECLQVIDVHIIIYFRLIAIKILHFGTHAKLLLRKHTVITGFFYSK